VDRTERLGILSADGRIYGLNKPSNLHFSLQRLRSPFDSVQPVNKIWLFTGKVKFDWSAKAVDERRLSLIGRFGDLEKSRKNFRVV
jgi:hypothetical protein